jgi:DNA modification methylase
MNATIWNEDCIAGMASRLEPASVDLTVTSIPFGALFMYSGRTEDVGNNEDGVDMVGSGFGLHMRFFVEQLARVQKPGTNACIHIQQLLAYKVQHGYMGRRDFRGAVIDLFGVGGFEYKGEFVIPKDPQAIAQRQHLNSLAFATAARNARDLAPYVNDFVLIFQRPGPTAVPVRALRTPDNPAGWLTTEEWIRDAHGVWTGIREMDVLDGWQGAREQGDEKHVCPLQMDVIRRLVRLYSNPGELVLDPFMGIGSTAVVALEQGRQACGFELKESYHRQAVRNAAHAAERREVALPLFEGLA